MMSARDVIAEFLHQEGVPREYQAADRLVAQLARTKTVGLGGSVDVRCTMFTGTNDAELLREIANWIEPSGAVLIGLWSTGFGAQLESCIQVITDLPV